ncbi:MAG: DUF2207 domain-containing protein [Candidatus Methylomirabilota bacterium]
MGRRLLLLGLVLLCAWTTPAGAGSPRSLLLERFDADIVVRSDGAVDVSETLQARFTGAWNGLFRTIPIEYRTPYGMNYTLRLDVTAVTDGAGAPLAYELSRQRAYRQIKVWVPGATDAVRTIVLRYRARQALKFFAEHDELYWNVTGDEWPFPILAASARITLPAGASGLRAAAFTGVRGSREQAAVVALGSGAVRVETTRGLSFREGLTAVVGWDPGLVHRPGRLERAWHLFASNWLLGVPVAVFGLMWALWFTRGRDPRRRPIAARYEPPAGLSPGELGTLLDNSPDQRDITATLVDLAVRGFLRIAEREEPALLGLSTTTDYRFSLHKPADAWEGLAPHERTILEALFPGGHAGQVDVSALEKRFYVHLPAIRDRLFERLLARGYYGERPDRVRRRFVLLGAVLFFAGSVLGLMVSGALGLSEFTPVLAAAASAACVIGFGWVMPARTLRGSRVLEEVLGFEEFLSRVEGDRLQRMAKTPALFEQYLPYAMALGVEARWAAAFADIYKQPPDWYQGRHPGPFHPASLVSSIDRMSTQTAAAMTSAPRSSGGSGFGGGGGGGGGGSSGGGMGGGGGGGF